MRSIHLVTPLTVTLSADKPASISLIHTSANARTGETRMSTEDTQSVQGTAWPSQPPVPSQPSQPSQPPRPAWRPARLPMAALGLGWVSLVLLAVGHVPSAVIWAVGTVVFVTSLVAVIRGESQRAGQSFAVIGLILAVPAFVGMLVAVAVNLL